MFSLFNVVTYDGCDAYVMKFIEDAIKEKNGGYKLSDAAKARIDKYCGGAGCEVLKCEFLYTLDLVNVVAFKEYGDAEQKAAVYRFEKCFFGLDD